MGEWTFQEWTAALTVASRALQAFALVFGGIWAFWLYRRSRRSQARVGIEQRGVRFHRSANDNLVLLVSIRIHNASDVLFRLLSGYATLLDASTKTFEGEIELVPFAQEDPFQAVYSSISFKREDVSGGKPFVGLESSKITLEPGEFVDTELAYLIETDSGLMAMQVMVEGKQRKWFGKRHWWSTYFYIVPSPAYNGDMKGRFLRAFK